jgi:1,4-dihydroxy-2-naphthoate octaprenyltransferase
VGVGIAGSIVGLIIGLYFVTQVGWWPLGGLMALGAVAVLIYTQFFARTGAGEVFAGLGLGLLPVIGTALVQRGEIGPAAWSRGVPRSSRRSTCCF